MSFYEIAESKNRKINITFRLKQLKTHENDNRLGFEVCFAPTGLAFL